MQEEAGSQAVLRYMNAARPAQKLIQDTLTQIAGFALLFMTSNRKASLAEGALLSAQEASARALDAVRALNAPEGATHHFHHLSQAATTLGHACSSALRCLRPAASEGERDKLIRALREASDHLRFASKLIPGFELVDLGQACCAPRAPRRLICEVETNVA